MVSMSSQHVRMKCLDIPYIANHILVFQHLGLRLNFINEIQFENTAVFYTVRDIPN
jgi:hypothetical protein